jgi:hypothetical protein
MRRLHHDASQPAPSHPQALRPEIKRIIEALAIDIVAREDMEAAAARARGVDEGPPPNLP